VAVSKRLRFEILRRDNHTCRYCGGVAPDVILTVDHVIPVSLGGSDEPTNLVAACKDCNAGKTSSNPDAPLVDTVADDALRWAAAMRQAADELAAADAAIEDILDAVAEAWKPYYKPADWAGSVVTFVKAGLSQDDLLAIVEVAYRKRGIDNNRWSYFCGCCWSRIRQMQDRAQEIVGAHQGGESPQPQLTTSWTRHDIDEKLRQAEGYAHRVLSQEMLDSIGCCHNGRGHCGDPVCMVEYATMLEMWAIDADTSRLREWAVCEEAEALLDG
jgi:hypothetical protein